jgi:hypothetical protein
LVTARDAWNAWTAVSSLAEAQRRNVPSGNDPGITLLKTHTTLKTQARAAAFLDKIIVLEGASLTWYGT